MGPVQALMLSCLALVSTLAVLALRRFGQGAHPTTWAPLAAALLAATCVAALRPTPRAARHPALPQTGPWRDYVTSNACRSCHPAEHASWHESYHRTMTQVASPETVAAPWDTELEWRGQRYRLFERDGEYWVRHPAAELLASDGPAAAGPAELERRVVMTTGSHHYQAYWLRGRRGNELLQLPFVFHLDSARFVPRDAAFVQPPDDPPHTARWNSNCIQCHSVAGQPRHDLDSDRFESRAVELGIACEACHGPGRQHVQRHRSPSARYRARADGVGDDSIVNPARLDAKSASEICGQCHAYFVPRDPGTWWESGFAAVHAPGRDLEVARQVLDYSEASALIHPAVAAALDSIFYADGTIRVGGREWNGLRSSACFERGIGEKQLGCLDCHRLHGGTRDDQLGPAGESNGICSPCHAEHTARPEAHSRHAPGSTGSSCVNCHMPHTAYALLKGIRSHRITIPAPDARPGAAPNACNLCHQSRSLAWTRSWLQTWYGSPSNATVEAPAEQDSPVLLGLLSGDAATRVIYASALGWEVARRLEDPSWAAAALVEALDDPYPAVRFVAYRSLRQRAEFADLEYDFVADREVRFVQLRAARARLSAPLDPDGVRRLLGVRDERPIRIPE